MKIGDILESKGRDVQTISPESSIQEAVQAMSAHNIGSLMVVSVDSEIIGIVTERDCVRAIAGNPGSLESGTVGSITTKEIVVASPDDDISYILGVMQRVDCRHVPVLDGGVLAGMISVRDVIRSQLDETTSDLKFLKDYIQRG